MWHWVGSYFYFFLQLHLREYHYEQVICANPDKKYSVIRLSLVLSLCALIYMIQGVSKGQTDIIIFLYSSNSPDPIIRLIKTCSCLLARPQSMRKSGRAVFSRSSGYFSKKSSYLLEIITRPISSKQHNIRIHIFVT